MTTYVESKQALDKLSAQVSTLVRVVAIGNLAVVWLFLAGEITDSSKVSGISISTLLIVAGLSLVSIVLDLVQYFIGYEQIKRARKIARFKATIDDMVAAYHTIKTDTVAPNPAVTEALLSAARKNPTLSDLRNSYKVLNAHLLRNGISVPDATPKTIVYDESLAKKLRNYAFYSKFWTALIAGFILVFSLLTAL